MELTYRQLVDTEKLVGELLQLKPAPTARLAAQIARNIRKVEGQLKDFNAAKGVLLTPYMVDDKYDEDLLEPAVKTALYKEYDELLDTVVEIDIHPVKLSDIETMEQARPGFEIPTALYYALDWLFDFDH